MENVTYRVERSACGGFVNCYYGREGIDVYSTPLRRVSWWDLLPWQEPPAFETGNNDIGCYVLACSILAHHFQETREQVSGHLFSGGFTYGRFFAFAVEVIRTQQLKPGDFYIITTEVINEWLVMLTKQNVPAIPDPPSLPITAARLDPRD